jgi:hypothetical protein
MTLASMRVQIPFTFSDLRKEGKGARSACHYHNENSLTTGAFSAHEEAEREPGLIPAYSAVFKILDFSNYFYIISARFSRRLARAQNGG